MEQNNKLLKNKYVAMTVKYVGDMLTLTDDEALSILMSNPELLNNPNFGVNVIFYNLLSSKWPTIK